MFFTTQDGSNNIDLASEQAIVQSIASYIPSFFLVLEGNETDIDEASIAQVEQLPPNVIDSLERSLDENADVWAELSIAQKEESEDAMLVNSGILQHLIAQAQQESPLSLSDWERELDKL